MNVNPFLISNKHAAHTFTTNNTSKTRQNTLKALIRGQITGKSFSSVRHLSPGFFSHMQKPFTILANLVVEMEDSIALQEGSKCEECLLSLSKKISELTNAFYSEHRDWFIQLRGPDLLVRILEFPPPNVNARARASVRRRSAPSANGSLPDTHAIKVRNHCMAILKELCFTHAIVGESLSTDDRLITFLFSLLSDGQTFDAAIGLLEEVLGAKAATYDLSLVPNFNALVRGMTKGQLGIFCRVLAMVVFEPDDRTNDDIVSSLDLLRARKKGRYVTPAIRNIDRNHAIVLGTPNLLERLVKLLRGTNQTENDRSNHLPSFSDLLAIHYYQSARGGVGVGNALLDDDDDDEDEENDENDENEENEDEEDDGERMDEEGGEGDEVMREGGADGDRERERRSGEGGETMTGGGRGRNRNSNSNGNSNGNGNGNGNSNGNGNGNGNGARDAEEMRMLYNMDQELEALMDGTAQTLKALALSTYQVELLFVLYALLAGKRKAELQDRLANLGLIHTATVLFDKTDWLKAPTPLAPHERQPHGPQCECNPDAALKIQLLRLILNFCDGDFENRKNKKLLLSSDELAVLYGTNQAMATVSSKVSNSNGSGLRRPVGSGPGLLSKLINVFYKLPQDQNNRFWMASCIEAFLRGSEPVFQKFVAKSGMLSYLIEEIVSDAQKVQGSMQTSFDLLGELMKFNREIFSEFNALMTGRKLTKFLSNVNTHLVDSNVFLRGMVLSMERFMEEDKIAQSDPSSHPNHTPYPFATCKISQFLDQNWFRLVKDLMTVVTIDAINQENICCVNTTMVFCIYARRKNQLRKFVETIHSEEADFKSNLGCKTLPTSVSTNFQKLLWFWHEYYLLRGKDCLSLEYTSQIPFSEWTATYEVLVEELGEFDPSSLYEQWREKKGGSASANTTTAKTTA